MIITSTPSSAASRVGLTAELLHFLYGDLAFDKKDIRELTGWSSRAINTLLEQEVIEKGSSRYHHLTDFEIGELSKRLNLSFSGTSSEHLAVVKRAILSKSRSQMLDWAVLNQFIADIPALQAEKERRSQALSQELGEHHRRQVQATQEATLYLRTHLREAQNQRPPHLPKVTQRDEANVLMAYLFKTTDLNHLGESPISFSAEELKKLKIKLSARLAVLLHLRLIDPDRYATFIMLNSRHLDEAPYGPWPEEKTTTYLPKKRASTSCSSCEKPVHTSWMFCPSCGQKLVPARARLLNKVVLRTMRLIRRRSSASG